MSTAKRNAYEYPKLMPVKKHRRLMAHLRECLAVCDKRCTPEEIEAAEIALGYRPPKVDVQKRRRG